jgi:hypothetical protein
MLEAVRTSVAKAKAKAVPLHGKWALGEEELKKLKLSNYTARRRLGGEEVRKLKLSHFTARRRLGERRLKS